MICQLGLFAKKEETATEVPNANGITGSPTPEGRDSDWVEPEHNQSNEASATTSTLPHPWDQPSSESDSLQDEPPPRTPTSEKGKVEAFSAAVIGGRYWIESGSFL
jgi:hypothetical protein